MDGSMTKPDLEITCENGNIISIWADTGVVEGLGDVAVTNRLPEFVAASCKEVLRQHANERMFMKRLSDTVAVDDTGVVWTRGGTVLSTMNGFKA